jgi:hypothetical protein
MQTQQSRQGEPLSQKTINQNQPEPELHPHDNCARVNPEDKLKGPAQQGKPISQTKTNESQQEPELHPHDTCARINPEDQVKNTAPPQGTDKENVWSNFTGMVKNIDEKEPIKGIHGAGVRVNREDSWNPEGQENIKRAPKREMNQEITNERDEQGNIITHLTGFIQNINENEPIKGIEGAGVRVHREDSWNPNPEEQETTKRGGNRDDGFQHRPSAEGGVMEHFNEMVRNIDGNERIMGPHGRGSRIAREDTLEYTEEQNQENAKRAMRQPEQRRPDDDNYQGTQVTEERDEQGNIITHLTGFIKEYDDIDPIKGIFGEGTRVKPGDKWQNVAKNYSNATQALGGYVIRQYYSEYLKDTEREPLKGPDGNCARVEPQDSVRYAETHGCS